MSNVLGVRNTNSLPTKSNRSGGHGGHQKNVQFGTAGYKTPYITDPENLTTKSSNLRRNVDKSSGNPIWATETFEPELSEVSMLERFRSQKTKDNDNYDRTDVLYTTPCKPVQLTTNTTKGTETGHCNKYHISASSKCTEYTNQLSEVAEAESKHPSDPAVSPRAPNMGFHQEGPLSDNKENIPPLWSFDELHSTEGDATLQPNGETGNVAEQKSKTSPIEKPETEDNVCRVKRYDELPTSPSLAEPQTSSWLSFLSTPSRMKETVTQAPEDATTTPASTVGGGGSSSSGGGGRRGEGRSSGNGAAGNGEGSGSNNGALSGNYGPSGSGDGGRDEGNGNGHDGHRRSARLFSRSGNETTDDDEEEEDEERETSTGYDTPEISASTPTAIHRPHARRYPNRRSQPVLSATPPPGDAPPTDLPNDLPDNSQESTTVAFAAVELTENVRNGSPPPSPDTNPPRRPSGVVALAASRRTNRSTGNGTRDRRAPVLSNLTVVAGNAGAQLHTATDPPTRPNGEAGRRRGTGTVQPLGRMAPPSPVDIQARQVRNTSQRGRNTVRTIPPVTHRGSPRRSQRPTSANEPRGGSAIPRSPQRPSTRLTNSLLLSVDSPDQRESHTALYSPEPNMNGSTLMKSPLRLRSGKNLAFEAPDPEEKERQKRERMRRIASVKEDNRLAERRLSTSTVASDASNQWGDAPRRTPSSSRPATPFGFQIWTSSRPSSTASNSTAPAQFTAPVSQSDNSDLDSAFNAGAKLGLVGITAPITRPAPPTEELIARNLRSRSIIYDPPATPPRGGRRDTDSEMNSRDPTGKAPTALPTFDEYLTGNGTASAAEPSAPHTPKRNLRSTCHPRTPTAPRTPSANDNTNEHGVMGGIVGLPELLLQTSRKKGHERFSSTEDSDREGPLRKKKRAP
ncbi:hypothetical protein M427DRAFT_156885 [Gonapodya prolifera JEL478]|uniref:Uncharacterized protein n=1 Tax=Gonapodya prolifera (strain JEL478) TaxID=1344416 RepID=A0A139A9Y2_GONPJ|nr:hypothetical protein M427DRAFT_156885 [Gonapodya prolifera JEL478]|eukprot:KXS13223.1 hypothetical protein M427DRAFT_156885 [Gonapodya prolifera JEL478]